MKTCRTCGLEKPLTDYSKWPNRNSFRPDCKPCVAQKQKDYLNSNPHQKEKTRQRANRVYWEQREKELPELLEKLETVRTCTTCGYTGPINDFFKRKGLKNIVSKVRLRGTCLSCHKKRTKKWLDKNPEKRKDYNKRTYARRKKDPVFIEQKKQYDREQYHNNPEYREKKRKWDRENKRTSQIAIWRRLLTNSLNQLHQNKTTSTQKTLRYNSQQLFNHIGNKPSEDYALDHKVPLSWMKDTTPAHIACNINNLQWITNKENHTKNNFYADPILSEYFIVLQPHLKEEYRDRFDQQVDITTDTKKEIVLQKWENNESAAHI